MSVSPPVFLCDAMLGGLARWLRAAGYRADFDPAADDRHLVRRALATGATLLSSDGGIFQRNVVRHRAVKALFVPPALSKAAQLAHVLRELKLPLLPMPRCMACGGELEELDKSAVQAQAPPRAYAACDRFWRCRRCRKLFWQGTHWGQILQTLRQAAQGG